MNSRPFPSDEQDNPQDSTDFTIPVVSGASPVTEGLIYDYFGIPLGLIPDTTEFSALPFRAYNLIWNDWFRDQNLQSSISVLKDNGPDASSNYNMASRGKRHDYFTSCLPFPQKGDAVTIPLGTTAPIFSDATPTTDALGIKDQIGAGAVWREMDTVGSPLNDVAVLSE